MIHSQLITADHSHLLQTDGLSFRGGVFGNRQADAHRHPFRKGCPIRTVILETAPARTSLAQGHGGKGSRTAADLTLPIRDSELTSPRDTATQPDTAIYSRFGICRNSEHCSGA